MSWVLSAIRSIADPMSPWLVTLGPRHCGTITITIVFTFKPDAPGFSAVW
jgi:hypothetical protein